MDNDSFGEDAGQARPPRDAMTPDFGQSAPALARTVQLVSGDFLLTVNPIDGSEIEPCPPGEQPARPARRSAAERVELLRAAQPPVPAGPASPRLPLLERDEERERLVRLLGRGRSVRLTGPAGSGRSALLDAVAEECADLAPDGVVRLSGYHRTPTELLYELFAIVHSAPLHRPDRAGLLEIVRDIGAIVVLDDLEFGGASLGELLDAAPECAFLVAATPDVAAPSADSHLEEVFLAGLGRSTSLDLLKRTVDRPLTEDEANWAGDLWFESEGLPLRFVQAGALLRQCDTLRADPETSEAYAPFDAVEGIDVPLPTLGEGAAPAALLASRLGKSARQTLRIAVALGGEIPHQAHLPALVGDTHADAALGELMSCGLVSPVGTRYRLAAGVMAQLTEKGYAQDALAHAHTAAQHYAWWAGHPSVTPERAVAESDAVLAALTALVPGQEAGHPSAAVLLARSAAPALAAGLHWGAWERALRAGSEAARIAGEVAEEAYFHHELGVLALCHGNLDRARAELEASIAMRGALADKRGTVAGRRALALVADRAGGPLLGGRSPAGEEVPAARYEESASPPRGIPAAVPLVGLGSGRAGGPVRPEEVTTLVAGQSAGGGTKWGRRLSVLGGARRNLVAAGAGALLAAVLGTVVTLGATSDQEDPPGSKVRNGQSANEDDAQDGMDAEEPAANSSNHPGGPGDGTEDPKDPGSVTPGATSSSGNASTPGGEPSSSASTPDGKPSTSGKPPTRPTTKPPTPTKPPATTFTPPTPSTTPPTATPTPTPTGTPADSTSASGPATTTSAPMTSSSAPGSTGSSGSTTESSPVM
ncbi:ATP-binding protein [Streptomyces sp. NBC_01142]|uniref:ATP-binding protein n=1 Tax=Streptomyces sp. NBC_01142 TaxID=2975865 RepID=UPI0022590928|nr:ATP-binding protein [Streptomyces sp. NBC_01142]MCX4819425.1 ATP-binding protein [Streptomyces sp. NBC_01142]